MTAGKYIVIEGNDGTGKSTQVELLHQKLESSGISCVEIHEPAGVPIADHIRDIIKNGTLERDGLVNVLLFTAARRAIWEQQIRPSLVKGIWVLSARSWISTVVYQGYGEGIDENLIHNITRQFVGESYLQTDLTCILHVDDTTRNERIVKRGELDKPDTFESKDQAFQGAVNNGYQVYAKANNLPVIDASRSIHAIHQDIWHLVQTLSEANFDE